MHTSNGYSIDAGLNKTQREAVLYLDGPCLVLAGAGSGKTRVITQKIAYLLRECAYVAQNIVALTFTNKAALEMSVRLRQLVEPKILKGITISTFHSLGLRILRAEAELCGLKSSFSIFDSNDALAIIQELLSTTDKARIREVQQTISLWKNALTSPDKAYHEANTASQIEAAQVYRSYCATLKAYQAVDFDDLISLPTELLHKNSEVRERWQSKIHYMLIDEYQDTNLCQYRLVQLLTGARAMFTAVGDDDQAIYAWRGATVENLMRLTQDYPSLNLIKLEQNYRSVQRILDAANSLIKHNTNALSKKLWSDHGMGEAIQVTPMNNEYHESESIAIRLSAARFERQAQWRDFAVLYRSNHQARLLEQSLRNMRIPYTVSGGQSFFDKAEIRDVLAWLRLLTNQEDDPAFIRAVTTPRRGVGQATLTALGNYAAANKTPLFAAALSVHNADILGARELKALQEFVAYVQNMHARATQRGPASNVKTLLSDLLKDIRYEYFLYDMLDDNAAARRWGNVQELIGWLSRKAEEDDMNLFDLVQHIALVTLLDRSEDEDPDTVKLSTIHASKGLEYPHVYLIGAEEGLLPHLGRDDEDTNNEDEGLLLLKRIQEERRLMYVGVTRAQRSLHITWCRKRRRAGEETTSEPSRFIKEMGLRVSPDDKDAVVDNMSPKQRLGMLKDLLAGKSDS